MLTNILSSILIFIITNFYSLQYKNIDGDVVSVNTYSGKKVLIVNIATTGPYSNQLVGLQQLQQQLGDSLVIIAIPSNSFGNEPNSNAAIKTYCTSQIHSTFIITEKMDVIQSSIHSLPYWLTHISENGAYGNAFSSDFNKFLIDREGNLVGIFSANVAPTDLKIINAINSY
ncbi:hypothetical protein ACFOWM_05560 [Ferruginibacter yonginensis]|uniref:Glutathione peroxidase n=1 Tax=Ferruginibacter yonginensis TaxID=1310416 RepID=A0ABV8QPY1_9BACT